MRYFLMGLFETNETKLQIIFLLIGPQPSIQDCIWVNTSELKHISDKSTWASGWQSYISIVMSRQIELNLWELLLHECGS